MPNFTPDKTVDNVIDALADYINLFATVPVLRANVNRNPTPKTDFIVLTEILTKPISKPVENYTNTGETMIQKQQIDVQVDFYGWAVSDIALAFMGSIRTIWGSYNHASWLALLYCSDIIKSPIINAEEQYEQRWTVTVSMQYNVTMTLPQETFNTTGVVESIPADIVFQIN